MGGLTAGALLAKEGYRVTLLEAAAEWGGCASKFQRKSYRFASGATLAMGYEHDGIHERINRHLNIALSVVPLEEVMRVEIGGRSLPYFTSRARMLKMWEEAEPEYAERIHAFYKKIWQAGTVLAKHMRSYPVLPPVKLRELIPVAERLSPGSFALIPNLNRTLGDLIEELDLGGCKSFIHFIDGTLMDSMQSTHAEVHFLMGAAALNVYHEGSFYVDGGLYEQAEAYVEVIKAHGGRVLKPRMVTSVKKMNGVWHVRDHRNNHYEAKHVVLNTGISQLPDILEHSVFESLSGRLKKRIDPKLQWGTYTQYFAVKEECIPPNAPYFYQIMLDPDLPGHGKNHFFISLSRKEDRLRAPAGFRTLTVSTHIKLNEWQDKTEYDRLSEDIHSAVLGKLEDLFPGFSDNQVIYESGGPVAWERFTKRKGGAVGGYPMNRNYALWRAVSHRTPHKGLWLCGDTVFPGAGSIGAASSGVHVARSITGRKLL
ncbi:FAD dependent oxidoreductase [Salisediminibacterium beveridgei]|uniref:FAD dependent oxidoreductase n=2 Tax=Salisediminibacterium beveridgei TaxID=632773 RepID=A0A1D7QV59_9BACI|nr:FAD dependent oxidoreductase [Salisediminibacterium beveridgei]